ncbi:MAG: hypothetical protein DCF19_04590 [Pseudanabaena frigida]|uniref:CHAT domain-containing protein n=1 Tax=Pseudanabaena frigida TaxID=945775 RepID=A0A2W4WJ71_9CYAN|nr:MAG: hypothetical protein DCF19_04590 [Pseudanabaena frigida]
MIHLFRLSLVCSLGLVPICPSACFLIPAIAQAQEDSRSLDADTLQKKASSLQQKGELKSALEIFQQVLKLRVARQDREGEAQTLNSLGSVYNDLGQYGSSLKFYQRSLAVSKEVNDRIGEGSILNNIGIVYRNLAQFSKALELYQQAIEIQKKSGDRYGIARTFNNIGLVYRSKKEWAEALRYYQQSLALIKELEKPAEEAIILNNIGFLYNKLGASPKAFESYQKSLAISQKLGDRKNESITLGNIGLVYSSLGQFDSALGYYQQALAISRQTGDRAGEAKLYQHIGFLLDERQQNALAIAYLKQSVNAYEEIRKDLNSLSRQEQKTFATNISPVYRRLADLLLQQDRVIEAQQVVDLLKVQELDDYLKNVRGNEQTAKGIDYQVLEIQMIALGKELYELQTLAKQGGLNPKQQERLTYLVDQEKESNRQFNAFLNSSEVQKIANDLKRSEQGQNINLQDLAKLQSELKQANAAILYPLVLDDRIELILLTPSAPPIHRLVQVNRADFNREISKFRSELQDTQLTEDYKPISQKFYGWLIAPLETELQQANIQTIIYAPDGQLRYVPLAALNDGKQWLIEKYRINNITALSLTDFKRQTASQPRILAAASTLAHKINVLGRSYSFGAIPATKIEVKNITSKIIGTTELIDSTFTKSATQDRIASNSIIHLATHGQFNSSGTADESFIIFGDGDNLTLSEIQTWTLKSLDLVVLSACQTGIGATLADGREILGLGYQFNNAGAKAVIASLWIVNDEGTQALMDIFYTNIKKGSTPAESLRQAQLTLIRGGKFPHPYFWSTFFLIGNGL